MKILVVEDHVLMREALRGVLKELKGDAAVIIEAPDSRQAMRQIEQNPDVELVLLDLGLPDRDRFEILSEFNERYPTISVVVHSAHQDRERVMKALDLASANETRVVAETARVSGGSGPDRAADGGASPDDAGQEQQGYRMMTNAERGCMGQDAKDVFGCHDGIESSSIERGVDTTECASAARLI